MKLSSKFMISLAVGLSLFSVMSPNVSARRYHARRIRVTRRNRRPVRRHHRSLKRYRKMVRHRRNKPYNGYRRWLKTVHPYSLKGLSPKIKTFATHPVTFHGIHYRSGLALAKSAHDSVKDVYQIVRAKNVKFAV